MLEWLNQIEWGFWEVLVAVVFGLAGASWALYERYKSKRDTRKNISFVVNYNSPLVDLSEAGDSRVQVTFDGQQVDNIYIALVVIANRGGVSIASGDFESDLAIDFGAEAKVLSAEITRTIPDEIESSIAAKDNLVRIKPLLLNEGDSIWIKAIGTDFSEAVRLRGRVVGVKEFTEVTESEFSARLRATALELLRAAAEAAIAGYIK